MICQGETPNMFARQWRDSSGYGRAVNTCTTVLNFTRHSGGVKPAFKEAAG